VHIDVGEDQLVEELLDHKSDALRRKLQEAEAELRQDRAELRALIARRDTLAPDRVERKLQALYKALTRKPFDVVQANAALKQAVRKITMDAQNGELSIYWRHAADGADPQVVVFPTFKRETKRTIATNNQNQRTNKLASDT
jgi:hypothetical protein